MTMGEGGWSVNSEYGTLRDVLLCRPDYFRWLPTSSISKATLRSGAAFDLQRVMAQHGEMVQAYQDAGVARHFLETEEALPYQVFARDSSFMSPYGAVVTQMNQWWRRGEYAAVIRFYRENDIPIFKMITAASFEGGDFDVIEPGCALIGYCGERTQEPAARQVRGWFEDKGWEVRLAPIAEHYVHIDLMVRSPNPNIACPYRRFSAGHGTVLPNPAPGRLNQHHSMIKAGDTAPYDSHPVAPTAQTVIVKPLSCRSKAIVQHSNPHRPGVAHRRA